MSALRGSIQTRGAVLVQHGEARIVVGNLAFQVGEDGSWYVVDGLGQVGNQSVAFVVSALTVDAPEGAPRLRAAGELTLGSYLAERLGLPQAAGTIVGRFSMDMRLSAAGAPEIIDDVNLESVEPAQALASTASVIGPDVIVGSLHQVSNFGSAGGISAFSVGTYSCNIGDVWLNWFSNNNQHPVIGANMFRMKDGRFEQVGQSWLKHGFYALSNNLCNVDCQHTNGSHLGVHCSDPYSASLNGTQYNLGPKWQVDPHSGDFPYPPSNPAYSGPVARRLQVKNWDLDPALGGGGRYFVEGQYVTPDDAAAGNQNNNASYREVNVGGVNTTWTISISPSETTQRMQPGIRAWRDNDPTVQETDIQVEGDGLFILAAKTVDLGEGWWHYEYALQNLNSNRAGGSFSIPLDPTGTVTNIDFHDVDYHSGEPFSGADWTPEFKNGALSWSTQSYAFNINANALRWGTLYNFRFDIDRQPQTTTATIGLFRPGTPTSVTASTVGPITSPADCNQNGLPDSIDIVEGTSVDCDQDTVPDECQSYVPVAQRIVVGLDRPVQVLAPPGDVDRVLIVEQSGTIRILSDGSLLEAPFIDLSSLVGQFQQVGLLSMAFDPNYDQTGRFYAAYIDPVGNVVIAQFNRTGDPNVALPSSRVILKTIGPVATVRSGGQIVFGPDGYLYVGVGDGGAPNDPLNHGQDTGVLRGKILRLDVNNPPNYIPSTNPYVEPELPLDEIWSIGVHDPWRFSFDRLTGELYLADIGQDTQDEINLVPVASAGGDNYGWRCMEGDNCTGLSGCTCDGPALTNPNWTRTRTGGECRLTGGFVYRGCALPNLLGEYFYADYCDGTIHSLRFENGSVVNDTDWTSELTSLEGPIPQIVSFGEDAAGEQYIVSYSGSIYGITRNPSGETLCGNGTLDPGEECDDGNAAAGDGCDAYCRLEPGPANDLCANAFPVDDGEYLFDSAGARTDGPDETVACQTDEFGGPVGSDVWYCYTASCSGTATASLCGSVFDSLVAAYEGCSCPSTSSAIACNDNACFGASEVSFPTTACQPYLIRIGGYDNDQGAGIMNLSCDPDPIINDCNANGVDDSADIACETVEDNNGDLVPDICEDGGMVRGGRLYDRWWAQTGALPPTTNHPLWDYRPDQTSNDATGAETWRCVECHGWDYKGANGLYGSGPHRTGFEGMLDTNLSAPELFTLLKEPPSNEAGPGVINGHDYGTVLSDAYINDLVEFVLFGVVDVDDYIDSESGAFQGDVAKGMNNFTSAGTQSQCTSCHGADGTEINFGTFLEPEYLGTVAVSEPSVFLHRARMGFPGTPMQGFLTNGGTTQGVADMGRYAQLSFPTECIDDAQCDDALSCTADSCDKAGRCVHSADDSICADNGVFCDGPEVCDSIVGCVSRGNPCSDVDACVEQSESCGCATPIVVAAGPRYLAITLQPVGGTAPTALRITPVCSKGVAKYLGSPDGPFNVAKIVDDPADGAWLTPAEWGGTVYVTGFDVAPDIEYLVEADCGRPGRAVLTLAASARTYVWGDVIDRFASDKFGPPDGQVDFTDISAMIDGFKELPSALPIYRLDLFGCSPDQQIDFIDISGDVSAFKGYTYLESSLCPGPCW